MDRYLPAMERALSMLWPMIITDASALALQRRRRSEVRLTDRDLAYLEFSGA